MEHELSQLLVILCNKQKQSGSYIAILGSTRLYNIAKSTSLEITNEEKPIVEKNF